MFKKIIILSLIWSSCSLFAGDGASAGGGSAGAGAAGLVPIAVSQYPEVKRKPILGLLFGQLYTKEHIARVAASRKISIEEAERYLFKKMPKPVPMR